MSMVLPPQVLRDVIPVDCAIHPLYWCQLRNRRVGVNAGAATILRCSGSV